MAFETKRETVISRTGEMSVDEGLRRYMLKVYNYMTIGLLITAFTSYLLAHTDMGMLFFSAETMQPNGLGWVAIIAPFVLIFMMSSAVSSGNGSLAFTLFVVYAALLGVSLTNIFWIYTDASLARVFLITAGTFAGMSLYGYTTKRDLTKFGSFLTMGLIGLIIAMVVNVFFIKSSAFDMTLDLIGIAIFVGLTAWDTWKIREIYTGRESDGEVTSKAIFGALMLYLDFINLFLMLLRFFGNRRN